MKIYIFKQTEKSIKLTKLLQKVGEEWRKKERGGKKTPRRSLMKIVYTVNGDLQPLENWFCVEARGG